MIFHLAIPAKNLEESEKFYRKLGAQVGRRYKTHIVLNIFSTQLVLHLSDEWDREPKMYPRHFGFIINSETLLKFLWTNYLSEPYVFEPYFIRHEGLPEEHHTFFLKDPSNNLIEFKWYRTESKVFG